MPMVGTVSNAREFLGASLQLPRHEARGSIAALCAAVAKFPDRDSHAPRLVSEVVLNSRSREHDDADRHHRQHEIVALEWCGFGVLRPIRLECDLRNLAVRRPFGRNQLGALW